MLGQKKMMTIQRRTKFALGGLAAVIVAATAAAPPARAASMAPMNAPVPSHVRAGDAPFLAHGKRINLQSFKGQPIMLWQVATWCGSCAVGLQTMAQNRALIDASDLKIIVLRDYKNGGYPGDSMEKFVAANAPALLHDSHFIIGKDTEALFNLYNPRHYVDVYDLIEPSGRIAMISSAPSVTFHKIEQFIKAKGKS
jgi:hypothetical protein